MRRVAVCLFAHCARAHGCLSGRSRCVVASSVMNNHVSVAEELLRHGAQFDAQDLSGLTAWHEAASGGHIQCLHLFERLGHSIQDAVPNVVGRHPIHMAAMEGHATWLALALDSCHNALLEVCDKDGCTPLYFAASRGKLACVNVLVTRGANANAASSKRSVLHCAAIWGHLECVQVLVRAGASVDSVDSAGHSVEEAAREVSQTEVADWLRGNR